MSFWTYERVLHAQNAWLKSQKDLPKDKETPTQEAPKANRADGFGPQL